MYFSMGRTMAFIGLFVSIFLLNSEIISNNVSICLSSVNEKNILDSFPPLTLGNQLEVANNVGAFL